MPARAHHTYRFVLFDTAGEIVREEKHDCVDDLSAITMAYALCVEHAVELWQGERYIAHLRCGERQTF